MGEGECLHKTHPEVVVTNELDDPHDDCLALKRLSAHLRPRWDTLYKQILPALARSKAPSQRHWPVHLDHCFARIIFDAVIGNSTQSSDLMPTPWTDRISAPAVKNMHPQQLEECIKLGEAIAEGKADLMELDKQSLAVRGKSKGQKRKREKEDHPPPNPPTKQKKTTTSTPSQPKQTSILSALGIPPSPTPQQQPPAPIPAPLHSQISSHPTLTPFRKRVLLTLCQVPPGQYTTYLALSNHLHSSPRAVGNALRNNPFAPRAPCHRVVAANGGIGGFGGEWGVDGKHNGEKVRLLREEGVKVEEGGGRVGGRVWTGFV